MSDHARSARRAPLGVLLLSAVFAAPSAQHDGREPAGPSIADAHDTIEQWVETRRVISREKRDWALGREVLQERVDLVGQEIESLRERIAETDESIAEANAKHTELVEENGRLKAASSSLVETIRALESRTLSLLARLPEPVRDRVKPLSQRFPDDPETTKLSLGERFQNVIGVLNEINKFNAEITLTSEVRTLDDGTSAEVTVMYLGIGQAYYVNAAGSAAGIGAPSPEGWSWRGADQAAERIAEAIAVLKNEQEATFVPLPIRID